MSFPKYILYMIQINLILHLHLKQYTMYVLKFINKKKPIVCVHLGMEHHGL